MPALSNKSSKADFSQILFEIMSRINPGIAELETYEFNYALKNLEPENGWNSIELDEPQAITEMLNSRVFYESIKSKEKINGKIVLDPHVLKLTQMLFSGLVSGAYSEKWLLENFYFDIRGFLFFHRTSYFTEEIIAHFSGKPYKKFKELQKQFDKFQAVGYKDFKKANAEVDKAFIKIVLTAIEAKGTPILLTLAGPTAAGKTEIMERLYNAFEEIGKKITTVEMDNFLVDREIRGEQPIGIATTHFKLFEQFLNDILKSKKVLIPRYDFIKATSSHDLQGNLRPGCTPIEIEPADIIFIEGNFPFQMKEITDLIGVKVVYLTDDPIRLKRKWKRDIDYRKKYDPIFFMNRYFKTQFLRNDECYLQQMKNCDIVVDTTGAALWVTSSLAELIK